MIRRYSELIRLKTFEERFEYLRIGGLVGESVFSFERYLNQALYTSQKWRLLRNKILVRDNGLDLGVPGHEIFGKIIVHHMNPLTREQFHEPDESMFDPEFLICVSEMTHRAIHYGDINLLNRGPAERRPNDTCPWKL